MMKIETNTFQAVTYNISNSLGENNGFYTDLKLFADKLLLEANVFVRADIKKYLQFVKESEIETPRTFDEYLVEFLAFGVFWNKYIYHANKSNALVVKSLTKLYQLRKQHTTIKPYVDKARGTLMPYLKHNNESSFKLNYTVNEVNMLISWLSASGDFTEEVIRFRNWQAYFNILNETDAKALIVKMTGFASYFEEQAFDILHKYTANVNGFLSTQKDEYYNREDYILTGRYEVEYHLNMVGAEVLNRVLRHRFENAAKKILLLPTCMSKPNDGVCKANKNGLEMTCTSCSKNCEINKIKNEFKAQGVDTYLIPHSSSFSKFLEKWKNNNEVGLIGVACVLNLLTGGYEMIKLNIPSQCIFLNYSGCKKHWHANGVAASLDVAQLHKLLQNTEQTTSEISYNKEIAFAS